jgi:hypothetical protein
MPVPLQVAQGPSGITINLYAPGSSNSRIEPTLFVRPTVAASADIGQTSAMIHETALPCRLFATASKSVATRGAESLNDDLLLARTTATFAEAAENVARTQASRTFDRIDGIDDARAIAC